MQICNGSNTQSWACLCSLIVICTGQFVLRHIYKGERPPTHVCTHVLTTGLTISMWFQKKIDIQKLHFFSLALFLSFQSTHHISDTGHLSSHS